MSLPALGGIWIRRIATDETLQLTSDPETYDPYLWPKRQSVWPVIGGRRVYQVAPKKYAVDAKVHLATGETQYLTLAVVQTLLAWDAQVGELFEVTDYEGNQYTALFIAVHPTKAPWKPALYRVEMELAVVMFTKLLGQPYTEDP